MHGHAFICVFMNVFLREQTAGMDCMKESCKLAKRDLNNHVFPLL